VATSWPVRTMSERTLWVWLLVFSGVACWVVAAGWIFRAPSGADSGLSTVRWKRAARIKGEQRDETTSILDQRHT
jgi:hypothetical protein